MHHRVLYLPPRATPLISSFSLFFRPHLLSYPRLSRYSHQDRPHAHGLRSNAVRRPVVSYVHPLPSHVLFRGVPRPLHCFSKRSRLRLALAHLPSTRERILVRIPGVAEASQTRSRRPRQSNKQETAREKSLPARGSSKILQQKTNIRKACKSMCPERTREQPRTNRQVRAHKNPPISVAVHVDEAPNTHQKHVK